jgi:hypothetical protein
MVTVSKWIVGGAIVVVLAWIVLGVGELTRKPVAVYTVTLAGVITAERSGAPGAGYFYTLDGRAGEVQVSSFIASSVAAIGDLLLAGDETPTWGYAGRPSGSDPACWQVAARGRVDGDWVEITLSNARGGIETHLRIPTAPDFVGVAPDGSLGGRFVCLDRTGTATSAS